MNSNEEALGKATMNLILAHPSKRGISKRSSKSMEEGQKFHSQIKFHDAIVLRISGQIIYFSSRVNLELGSNKNDIMEETQTKIHLGKIKR